MQDSLILPDYITKMIEEGLLGNKTRSGFYKKGEDGRMMFFDPSSFQYIYSREPNIDFVEKAKHLIHMGMYKEAFDGIKSAECKEAQIVMNILCTYISYSYSRIGEVTRSEYGTDGIDRVMSGGYHWASPSLILTMLGGGQTVRELLKQHSLVVPDRLEDVPDAAGAILKSGKFFVAH
jgi:3-hydroxyacyl-CoA dehydrogenase